MKSRSPQPPNWSVALLKCLCKPHLLEEIEGDLLELYHYWIQTHGISKANWLYILHTIKFLRPFALKSILQLSFINTNLMYQHHFKIGFRRLIRDKVYSLINIGGLAVGMGACLLICQYVYFELSYDKFHHNYENTYRIIIQKANGDSNDSYPNCGYDLGVEAKEEIPEVKDYVRKYWFSRGGIVTDPVNNNAFHKDAADILFVDKSFLQVFNFPLKSGNQQSPFSDKYSIVITEKASTKYFGSANPIGNVLEINAPISSGTYTITGILKDLPLNGHMQFEFLVPIENFLENGWGGVVKKQGGWNGFKTITYLTIDPSADLDLVCQKLNKIIEKHKDEGGGNKGVMKKVSLQPIADIYMKSDSFSYPGYFSVTGNIENVKVFAIISLFILFLAWINYINLSTARSMHRAKEIGVRKSIGAFRKQLIGQFISESMLINVIASVLALAVALLLLPVLNHVAGMEMGMSIMQIPAFWVWFSVVVLSGSLLSGIYPAFVLSAASPISMLGVSKTLRIGNVGLRRGLIVFQFVISLLLASGTYLIYRQTTFMKNQELGIEMEKILILRGPQANWNDKEALAKFSTFKNEMISHNSITNVAGSLSFPGEFGGGNNFRSADKPVDTAPYSRGFNVGVGFPEAYDLEFVAGNSFRDGMPDEQTVIINEEAVRTFGFGTPENAINKKLVNDDRVFTIVGVVKNFHWHSLVEGHMAYVITLYNTIVHQYISVRMNLSDIPASLTHMESVYKSFFPGRPFEYFFADEAFNSKYQSEVQFGNLFSAFSALAIFIACIGLFALVSFTATLKVKEIGIRKVLGASIGNLMMLLSREYLMLISIAVVLTIPAILYLGGVWLDHYAFRIDIEPDLFIVPALVLILISIITVSQRIYSTANADPVDSLRTE